MRNHNNQRNKRHHNQRHKRKQQQPLPRPWVAQQEHLQDHESLGAT